MQNKHPIHQIYAETSLVGSTEDIKLYDCRAKPNQPIVIDSHLVLFSNPVKAAKFIQLKELDHGEDFTSKQLTTHNQILNSISELNLLGVVIDPCPNCDWFEAIKADDTQKFGTDIENEKKLNLRRIESVRQCAQKLINEQKFGDAVDILITATAHIDCSSADLHFMLGISAFHLKDHENLNHSFNNLKVLNPQAFANLKKVTAPFQ